MRHVDIICLLIWYTDKRHFYGSFVKMDTWMKLVRKHQTTPNWGSLFHIIRLYSAKVAKVMRHTYTPTQTPNKTKHETPEGLPPTEREWWKLRKKPLATLAKDKDLSGTTGKIRRVPYWSALLTLVSQVCCEYNGTLSVLFVHFLSPKSFQNEKLNKKVMASFLPTNKVSKKIQILFQKAASTSC